MKRYVYLSEENVVINIIAEFDDKFPYIPIEKRYSKEFLDKCIVIEDENIEIKQHYIYNKETNLFEEPKVEEIIETPDEEDAEIEKGEEEISTEGESELEV